MPYKYAGISILLELVIEKKTCESENHSQSLMLEFDAS